MPLAQPDSAARTPQDQPDLTLRTLLAAVAMAGATLVALSAVNEWFIDSYALRVEPPLSKVRYVPLAVGAYLAVFSVWMAYTTRRWPTPLHLAPLAYPWARDHPGRFGSTQE